MSTTGAVPGPMEIRIYFIDDQAADLVRSFDSWWQNHGPKNARYRIEYLSQPPWLDEATQKRIDAFDPDLIALDLVLQHDVQSGERVLRKLKTSKDLSVFPVFVYSSQFSGIKDDDSRLKNERKYKGWGAQGLFAKLDGDDYVFGKFVQFALSKKQDASGAVAP